MGGRAVEGTGLENRRGSDVTVGSNPTPSAINQLISLDFIGLSGKVSNLFVRSNTLCSSNVRIDAWATPGWLAA